ncbi:suppressor of loss of ypt1 [Lobosporangium transversale]|uniref:Triose-phosphate transporter family-domain-containing protein n=1 Tax=Lobosporangium transversale TaxID=64571 RepID=A0A1Y2GCJ4_9FUNG|nr:triose-phosphate transporter family-domain-containing protein [Lobosporangium transversale]KAF9909092.1 suppressor of loss of ypt1 [Lobosporangium transversale]ORZ07021.1 triose-phosphate transporter family-domain-containing protein [Lobosporangium transversale]|eukprot:XP_021877817.1 triose-phosphate transporter family-domain-containing protein [Lobosporangium transversale]
MVTATAATSVPPLCQPHLYQPAKPKDQSASAASAAATPVHRNQAHQASQMQHQQQQQQISTADVLFETPGQQNNDSIPFFNDHSISNGTSIENPLMVHVQQLPTPRTSFSSGGASPPENLSPSSHPNVYHTLQQTQQSRLTPTSLASTASSPFSSPVPTLPSTIASTPVYDDSHINGLSLSGNTPISSLPKSPLSTSHLYQPQSYPALRSTSPALSSTLGPSLHDPSTSSSITHGLNASYPTGSNIYHMGGTSNTLGSRPPNQTQYLNDQHQFRMQQQEQLYLDDEKEQLKKNTRSALNGVATFLPPALNQGLSKVVYSAQEAISSTNSKLSLPSSRSSINGSSSSTATGLSMNASSVRGVLLRLYRSSKLPLLCLLWYLSSAVTNNIGKQIMNQFRYPVTLTFVQFVFVSLFCFILGSVFKMTTIRKPTMGILQMTAPLVGFQVVGHMFSSVAISRVPLSFVHTIKALSPLFTVIFYRVILGTTYNRDVYISLIPLTAGVMLACRLSLEFNNLVGLVCALASTLVFVTQNVFTKKILFSNKAKQEKLGGLGNKEVTKEDDPVEDIGTNAQKLDKINILFYSSTMAAICMIPIWLYAEGVGLLFPEETGVNHAVYSSNFWGIAWLLFLNGTSHFFQNIFAFSVLAITSPVTYSIASLVKRIVVIVASIIYFHQTLGATQWTGVCLTFWGLWLYNSAKNSAKVRPVGGILASANVGRGGSRSFGRGLLDTDRKAGFLA